MPHTLLRLRPLRRITLAALGVLLAALPQARAAEIPLPDIGASAGALLTPAQEERIGDQFMRSVRRTLPVVDDPLLTDYIDTLGQRLASKADRGPLGFHFFMIDQPVINAFAGPAGHIGVYTGLILDTESEAELASVLAHEIAHVTQHHLLRAYENASQMSGPLAALLVAAIVLGSQVGSNAGVAAAAGVQAAAMQEQINFTRENEEEADRVGIQILAKAGFDPHAMPVFFERLAKASRLYENDAPEFLRDHPVTSARIADAMGRADSYPYKQVPDSKSYFIVRTILRDESFSNARDAVTYFADALKQGRYRDRDATRYGLARALLRDHRPKQARDELKPLLKQSPGTTAYLLLDASIDDAMDQWPRALKHLSADLQLYPGNYPLSRAYAEMALEHGKGATAIPALDEALKLHPEQPSLNRLRARAAEAAGNTGDAHLYLAEADYLNGRLESAAQQLRAALRTEKLSFYQASRMQAKLEQIKNDLKARKEAAKSDPK
jgi:predicted Zn-dependent protease